MINKNNDVLVITIICLAFMVGCAPKLNHVNKDVLVRNQGSPFYIGLVKVAECDPPFFDKVDKKTEALNNIQIDKIIDVLQSQYHLEINKTVNKEVKVVKEKAGGQTAPNPASNSGVSVRLMLTCDNPYYGNWEYTENNRFKSLFGFDPELKKADIDKTINVLYLYSVTPFTFKVHYSYLVTAYAGEEMVFQHGGDVATISAPMTGPFISNEGIMNEMIKYAPEIDKALLKDIAAYNTQPMK